MCSADDKEKEEGSAKLGVLSFIKATFLCMHRIFLWVMPKKM